MHKTRKPDQKTLTFLTRTIEQKFTDSHKIKLELKIQSRKTRKTLKDSLKREPKDF